MRSSGVLSVGAVGFGVSEALGCQKLEALRASISHAVWTAKRDTALANPGGHSISPKDPRRHFVVLRVQRGSKIIIVEDGLRIIKLYGPFRDMLSLTLHMVAVQNTCPQHGHKVDSLFKV